MLGPQSHLVAITTADMEQQQIWNNSRYGTTADMEILITIDHNVTP
jgi:hypothetical protein